MTVNIQFFSCTAFYIVTFMCEFYPGTLTVTIIIKQKKKNEFLSTNQHTFLFKAFIH